MSELILMVGKSGSGKNFLCDKWGLNSIPSFTTRPMRHGEEDGREHFYIPNDETPSDEYFAKHCAAYTFFNGYHYWTTFEQIMDKKYNVYIIDVAGVDYILKYKQMLLRKIKVFYIQTKWYIRLYRMIKRGDGIKKAIRRFINDEKEFADFEKVLQKHNIQNYYIFEN